jgi:nicotine blue oxidoreductase
VDEKTRRGHNGPRDSRHRPRGRRLAHEVETDAPTVDCPEWERGPGASLRCGLAALPAEAEAAVVVLADGPELNPAAVERVVEAWRATGAPIVAATYAGARSHPVVVARSAWAEIPDDGLRRVPAELVPCDDLGPPGDVDYPEDLDRYRRGFRRD